MVLLWLLPPLVVTMAAMVWVSWLGREGRGEVDREVALRRMGKALERERRRPLPGYAAPEAPADRSTGVAVRTPRPAPSDEPPQEHRRAS